MTFWPKVPRFYDKCETDEERLKQRIRRAFEKADMEERNYLGLAELVYEKIKLHVRMEVK